MVVTQKVSAVRGLALIVVCLLTAGGCSDDAVPSDAGTETDSSIPPSCTRSFAYLESRMFAPPHPQALAPVPAPIPSVTGVNRVLRPESGEIGVRSWWLTTANDARITLSLSATSDILTGSDSVTIWVAINGQPSVLASTTADVWLDRVTVPVVAQSATVTVRLRPDSLGAGLNSLHFFYTLTTPGAVVENWDDAFPSLALFIGSTEAPAIAVDNELVTAMGPRIPFGTSEVSIGSTGPTVGHVVGRVDEVVDEGLFVQAQTSEAMNACRMDGRFAYVVLVDDVPVPITPDGRTAIVLDVPHDSRLVVPLSLGVLPRDGEDHRLQVRQIGGVGFPLEDDEGSLVPWGRFQSRLADIVW